MTLPGESAPTTPAPMGAAAVDETQWVRVRRLDFASCEFTHRNDRDTPQGGLVARANLTRTGVFTYRNADGSARRELRHPDEVFEKESLDSLAHAPLTDDHPSSKVTPDTWRQDAIGHVSGRPEPAGEFVASDIRIQHGPAIAKATAKPPKLQEASCGYDCLYDPTPGEYKGERYDGVQRRIRYNHVALGPPGWGRAGSDVRMRLDGGDDAPIGIGAIEPDPRAANVPVDRADSITKGTPYVRAEMAMTPEEQAAFDKAKSDAAAAQAATQTALSDLAKARQDTATLQGEVGVVKSQLSKLTETSVRDDATAKHEMDLQEAIDLRQDAASIFTDEDKWSPKGKGNDQIRREAIAKMDPSLKLDSILAPLADNEKAKAAVVTSTYRIAKTHFDARKAADEKLRAALRGDGKDTEAGDPADMDGAQAEMTKRRRDRFKSSRDAKK